MIELSRYREVDVYGSPFELGCQIGEACREEVQGFSEIALERVNKSIPVSVNQARNIAARSIPFVKDYSEDMLDELRGVSHGSGVSVEELMFLNIRNQLKPENEAGCTAFSLSPDMTDNHQSTLGQNWDNDPALDPFTIVLTRRPNNKPALMNITQAGLIAYIGLNDARIGVGLTALPAPSRTVGVPHYFLVRGIFETEDLEGAENVVRRAERVVSNNVILSTPQGPADLEITPDGVGVLREEILTHTNHCLHPDLVYINGLFPELIQSNPRKKRIDLVFSSMIGRKFSLESLKRVLRDHQDYPKSICRHPNDHPQNGFWTSVFSVIIEADQGRMHISRGNPCVNPYEVYELE